MNTLTRNETPALPRFFGDHPFWRLRHELEDAFENAFGESSLFQSGEMIPCVDVSETEEGLQVETDLPGFKPEEVDVEVNHSYLTISGTPTEEQEEEENGRKYHRIERHTGSFSRAVLLPCAVKQDDISAELKEGVLTITLPKTDESSRQKITVKG